jgi:hypothetical protein
LIGIKNIVLIIKKGGCMRFKFLVWGLLVLFPVVVFAEVKFTPIASIRLREEYLNNVLDLDRTVESDKRNYIRTRTQLGGKIDFTKDINFGLRLTNENRAYFQPSEPYEIHEVVMDNLYLELKNVFGSPLSFKAGRQDFLDYPDMFIIGEGTPLDGGRTLYFDAVRTQFDFNKQISLQYIALRNDEKDHKLPRMNDQSNFIARGEFGLVSPQKVNVADEQGHIAYLKMKPSDKLRVDAYYVHKLVKTASKAKTNALGGYAKYDFDPFALRGQYVYEFGDLGQYSRRAFGGYGWLDYKLNMKMKPMVSLGYMYLSGDNPDTAKIEAFDPLFGRTAWPNDIMYFIITKEATAYSGGAMQAYWTNTQMLSLKMSVNPTDKMKFTLGYDCFMAPYQRTGTFSTNVPYGDGKIKGHSPNGLLTYNFNKNLAGKLMIYEFLPGSFYGPQADSATFFQWEINLKY